MQYKPARLFNIEKALRETVLDIAKLEYYYFLKLSNEHSLSLETFIDLVEYNLVFNTTYNEIRVIHMFKGFLLIFRTGWIQPRFHV